jgi:catechol 2,3-dioxygenase-like lactoylglutathione lyase family enzyme
MVAAMSTTAPTIGVSGVDFVTVSTTDLDASVEFYRDTLGLEQSKFWGSDQATAKGCEFETGSLTIAVMHAERLGREHAPSPGIIALRVDDTHAARELLESRGVSFFGDTIDSGVCHMAIFADPHGNMLMLHHRYAPH